LFNCSGVPRARRRLVERGWLWLEDAALCFQGYEDALKGKVATRSFDAQARLNAYRGYIDPRSKSNTRLNCGQKQHWKPASPIQTGGPLLGCWPRIRTRQLEPMIVISSPASTVLLRQ
jgi:hypothetical protein